MAPQVMVNWSQQDLAAFLQTVMSINHADKPDAALPGLPMQGGKVPVGHKP